MNLTYNYENIGKRGVLVTVVTTDEQGGYLGQSTSFMEGLHVHPDKLEDETVELVEHIPFLQIMNAKEDEAYKESLKKK
jgi:hypothetical protein